MATVLGVHVPAIVVYALLRDATVLHALVEATLPALLVAVAVLHDDRRTRALAVALGLITCSAIFVHLSGGLIEWHFHYFVTLALIALYQEWMVYLLALGFVVVQHALGSWLSFHSVYNHGNGEFYWALVHGAFVLAASACHIAAWRFHEVATERAEGFRRELQEGEASLMAQLEQTAQIRSDLIATASHEFRTPLTAIGGTARTLQRHGDSLSKAERSDLLDAIVDRTERLGQMLESMLIAAQVEPPQVDTTPIAVVVDDVLALDRFGDVRSDVPLDIWVSCGRRPLGQLVERSLDSAWSEGNRGAPVSLVVKGEGDEVQLTVSVPASGLNAQAIAALLEPFRGGTDVTPRSADVGLGLYAVRRIAEVHGGTTDVRIDEGCFIIDVVLPRAYPEVPVPRRTSPDVMRSPSVG
jgi:signal transduction histidine kinase